MFFLPVLFVVAATCTTGRGISDSIPPKTFGSSTQLNKTILLELVNKARKSGCNCGDTYYSAAPALSWNNLLETAAADHATDMFQNKYFSHTSPDGSGAGARIERSGYHWMTYGENIGSGYKNEHEVIDGWLQSVYHCKNIMNKEYKDMGAARAGNVWVQEFATKK